MSLQRVAFSPLHTFTRATDETFFNQVVDSFGNVSYELQTAPSGTAVQNAYDPATGEPLGLQVFEQRTNRWLYSTNLLNVYWAGTRIVNSETSTPSVIDGVTWKRATATETNANGFFFRSPITALDGITTISSQYIVKKGNKDWCLINAIGSGGGACRQWFNLSTGEKGAQVNAGTVGDVTFVGSTIEGLGGNAYKITMTVTFNTSVNNYFNMYPAANADSSLAVELNDYADFCYQGAEAGAFATPPIFTEATTATRNASVAVINDIDESEWWNAVQSTFVISWYKGASSNGEIFNIFSGADPQLILRQDTTTVAISNRTGGSFTTVSASGSLNDGLNTAIVKIFSDGTTSCALNGSAETFNSAVITNIALSDSIKFGTRAPLATTMLNGHIAKLIYTPSAGV